MDRETTTTREHPDGSVSTTRTVEVDRGERRDERRGGGGTVLLVIVLLVAIGAAIYFFSGMSQAEIAKDNAVSEAAGEVGDAAQNVGDAAQDAADTIAGE